MTNELGREMTSVERIAVATGQTTIMDILHGVALELDAEWSAEVHAVMPSGTVITRGALWAEMCSVRAPRPVTTGQRGGWIVGVNASSNMFA
jgi:hypothetical protein